jgi:hypothetical protein
LLRDLTRPFEDDFTVKGENSSEAALAAVHEMATACVPVALLLVDAGSCELLDCAHQWHPHAKRVLLIDRDYSSTSPAEPVVVMGRADYHLVRSWVDDEAMYRALSEYLSSWTHEGTSPMTRNYPGLPHDISGGTLTDQMCEQAWLMEGMSCSLLQAVCLEPCGARRVVRMNDHGRVSARAVVISTGLGWRRLSVPRLEARVGCAVYHGAAVNERRAMPDQDPLSVGAASSTGRAARHLAHYARTVTLVVRSESFARLPTVQPVREPAASATG